MTRFFRASGMLGLGFALGVVVTSAGMAFAVMGKQGWDRWGPMFKQGYAAGFNDAVRMAKTSDPQSFLAKQFRLPPEAKALDWVVMIDQLYAEEGNENRPLPQIFSIAGPRLEARFGTEAEGQRRAFEKQREAQDESAGGTACGRRSDSGSRFRAGRRTRPRSARRAREHSRRQSHPGLGSGREARRGEVVVTVSPPNCSGVAR